MKKPNTLRELYYLVNPRDLLEVLGFSGVNDKPGSRHQEIKRKFDEVVWDSVYFSGWSDERRFHDKEPRSLNTAIPEEWYDSIIKCIQDYYRWTRGFNHHNFVHIYKRVINALDIDMDKIKEIMDDIE